MGECRVRGWLLENAGGVVGAAGGDAGDQGALESTEPINLLSSWLLGRKSSERDSLGGNLQLPLQGQG